MYKKTRKSIKPSTSAFWGMFVNISAATALIHWLWNTWIALFDSSIPNLPWPQAIVIAAFCYSSKTVYLSKIADILHSQNEK